MTHTHTPFGNVRVFSHFFTTTQKKKKNEKESKERKKKGENNSLTETVLMGRIPTFVTPAELRMGWKIKRNESSYRGVGKE
jgi:hypothetical protein